MTLQEFTKAAETVFFGGDPQKIADLGLIALSLALMASFACSLLWSWAYSMFYGSRSTGSNIHRSFPLIGIAVAAIFICVQFSLPLSLGLLGSLSIVRFRTPIKEPEEIGFILLVIASSLCCAAFNGAFLLVIVATSMLALTILHWSPGFMMRRGGVGSLVLKCPANDYRDKLPQLISTIERHLKRPAFDSLTTLGEECVLTWSFQKMTPLHCAELQRELMDKMPQATLGVYYHGQANG